jgi:hypothetical protein
MYVIGKGIALGGRKNKATRDDNAAQKLAQEIPEERRRRLGRCLAFSSP